MNELVDILTEDGKLVNKRINKIDAHKEGICHGISAVALIDNNGHLLIQKRSFNKDTEPSKWDLSGAGHININESSVDAAIRELYEETGIKVNSEDIKLIDTYLNKVKISGDCFINHYTYLFIVQKDIDLNNINIQESEVSDIKLINKDQYIELINNNEFVEAIKYCNKLSDYMK